MTADCRKRLFIVGCPRSGTTILQAVLSTHSDVVSFPESDFIRSLMRLQEFYEFGNSGNGLMEKIATCRRRAMLSFGLGSLNGRVAMTGFLKDIGREDLTSMLPESRRKVEENMRAFSDVLDRLADAQQSQHWIEKTPDHVFCIPWITKYLENYKIIHIIRRGEDVIASLFDAAMKYKDQHWHKDYSDIDRCIDRWLISVNASLGYLDQTGHYHLLYNHFMKDPEVATRALCSFLGIAYESKMTEDPFSVSGDIVRSGEKWKRGLSGEDGMKEASSKFATVFTQDQQKYVSGRIKAAGLDWDRLVSTVEGD